MNWLNSNLEDNLEKLETPEKEVEETVDTTDTSKVAKVSKAKTKKSLPKPTYIAVRGITYERVTPKIRVEPGGKVPDVILNDTPVFNNFIGKGVIKEG